MLDTVDAPDSPGTAPKMLIDTDVHEVMLQTDALLPYLEPQWQRVVKDYGWVGGSSGPGAFPYAYPFHHGGNQAQWVPEDGSYPGSSPEAMVQHLFEDEGVTHAVLCGGFRPGSLLGAYELATALAAAYNDWQIEHWLSKDNRLFGSVHVVPHDPHAAAREIDRVAEHPQMVQVFLPLDSERQFGDPMYRPIFEAASRHRLAIGMHHGMDTVPVGGYPRNWIEWHMLAPPQAAMKQLSSLIFNGVFDEFPELNLSLLEAGVAWAPWYAWRADEHFKMARVDVPWVKRLPSDQMRSNVVIGTQPCADVTVAQLVQLIEMADLGDVFAFSTDYPHFDADSPAKVLTKGMPEEMRDKIAYKNALRAFPRLRAAVPA